MRCAQLQSHDGQNTAAGTHVEDLHTRFHIFFQFTDDQLCGLMHTCTEGCTRIDMDDHAVFILWLYLFPGRNNEDIVHIELLEELLPVVDPVLVLGLARGDRTVTDIHKLSQLIQLTARISNDRIQILILIHIEIQICDTIVLRHIRHHTDKHGFLVRLRKRFFILDLRPLQTNLSQRRNDDILGICLCFYCNLIPFHGLFPPDVKKLGPTDHCMI